ncbi:hypothetical protein L1987_58035 [Smallanthus sonchifolius]|uniref:Uncharacterized protein n=1 Tax=Smallanthus sonchifolius TaxID=185202 RepID=A0ACB9DEE1_9ASTR|nr:hypothetical protein L1987_58035 [Smallanthus sonchifolius]
MKRPPVGWKYDNERRLYIVRRYKGGVEHFKTSHEFSSLPRYELRELSKLTLQNLGKVNEARNFKMFLKQKALNDFRLMKTTLLKRIISKTRINPRTQKPWSILLAYLVSMHDLPPAYLLERTGIYLSDDIIRGIFNDDLHLSITSKEVQKDAVETLDQGKAIGETKMHISKPRCRVREMPEAAEARECFKAFTSEIKEKEGREKKINTDET